MPARLYHERVIAPAASPPRWLLMTHGIFGAGGNWRTIAKRIVERVPSWGIVLVDLRLHGRSTAGEPPHTVPACADDVAALIAALHTSDTAVAAACGHSFGGKVVLSLRERVPLLQTWVLDATPSARPADLAALDAQVADPDGNMVLRVLADLGDLPMRWPRRDDFVRAMMDRGHTLGLSQWLAMNLESDGDGLRLRLDLAAIRQLLADYYQRDVWSGVERADLTGDVHVVIAENSSTIPQIDRDRLDTDAATMPHVFVDRVANAGHWLHLDAPDAVVDLLAKGLGAA